MSFTINTFRSSIGRQNGISRPNLFDVIISGRGATDIPLNFLFQAKIATIPPSTLGVIEVPYFGRMIKVPGNRTFDNLSLTVINDTNFSVRNPVEAWMAKFNIQITHYGIDKVPTGIWRFVNCFPVSLGEIGLDWGSNDTAEEFTIDFAYDYWTHPGGAE